MKKFAFIAIALLLVFQASAQNNCEGVSQWDTAANYLAGDRVQISGLLYEATKDNFCRNPCYPSEEWDVNPWVLIDTCTVTCQNADTYSATAEYGLNAIVKFEGFLYIALWGGNLNNQPDLNSGSWGAWKKLFECQVCVTVEHDCASFEFSTGALDDEGRVCVSRGTEVTFTAHEQTDKLARVIGSATQTLVVIEDTTITFDCEYAVFVTISGNCVVSPDNGEYTYWPSDQSDLTVAISAPVLADRECRINSITINGVAAQAVELVDIAIDYNIVHECECQVCVDISGDCVNSPDSRTCAYASDAERLEVTVEAPEQEGFICQIDSIKVDGVEVAEVVFDPLDADHTVETDCSCRPICPHFYGCDNTPLYSSAYDQVYNGCDCVKQIFDCPNGEGTAIVFCAPEGATIRCDQNIFDGHLIWQFQAICVGTVVEYLPGESYAGGSIVRKDGICYVAKWYATNDPATNFGLYQEYRYLGVC